MPSIVGQYYAKYLVNCVKVKLVAFTCILPPGLISPCFIASKT